MLHSAAADALIKELRHCMACRRACHVPSRAGRSGVGGFGIIVRLPPCPPGQAGRAVAGRPAAITYPFGGKKTRVRTSMLSLGGAFGGARGFSNEV